MKIITKTQIVASGIALTKKEIEILSSAQQIVNKLWDELEDADTLDSTAERICHNIDEIGNCLNNIVELVDIED